MKLTRYLSVLQIELLNVFNQTENNCILLAEIETIIQYKLTDENVQKYNFLIETIKSFFV